MFSKLASKRRAMPISVGKRFRAADGTVWAFRGYAVTRADVPHVSLVSSADPTAIKIISAATLSDRRRFNPIL